MYSQINKQAGKSTPGFLWKMQSVHINKPIYIKNIQDAGQKHTSGKRYVPWLSLIAIKI